jgi:exodeoxyribonuclease VII large subunit
MEISLRANNMTALMARLQSGLAERGTHAEALRAVMQNALSQKAGMRKDVQNYRMATCSAMHATLERASNRLCVQAGKLDALDPMRVLSRGYTIVEDEEGKAVCKAESLKPGQKISARFSDGRAIADVKEVELNDR